MPNRKRNLNTSQPPEDYEVSIEEAIDSIMCLWEAIEIAKTGKRGDILMVGDTRVAVPGCCRGDNANVHVTVCPEYTMPDLRLVKD